MECQTLQTLEISVEEGTPINKKMLENLFKNYYINIKKEKKRNCSWLFYEKKIF
jgi:hypothetical protein